VQPLPSPYVAVVGPGRDATERDVGLAEAVGRLVAERGGTVVTGGNGGVMAAACRGAAGAGGPSIGILPGLERHTANPWCTVVVATGLGEARNALVVSSADAVISVGGSAGTLSEIGLATRAGKPYVGVRGWRVLDSDGEPLAAYPTVSTPGEAVAFVWAACGPAQPAP
jgi:uncharacterized protein (TIGR00725 family)